MSGPAHDDFFSERETRQTETIEATYCAVAALVHHGCMLAGVARDTLRAARPMVQEAYAGLDPVADHAVHVLAQLAEDLEAAGRRYFPDLFPDEPGPPDEPRS